MLKLDPPRWLATWGSRGVVGLAAVLTVALVALIAGPKVLPYQTLFVLSGSMEPTIPVGSLIVLQPVSADQLAVGDVITFQHPERGTELVTHRLVGIEDGPGGRSFVTKGDANGFPDGWRVLAKGSGWRYSFAIPLLGYAVGTLQTPLVRLLLLVLPALALGGLTLVDVWRPKQAPETV